VALWPGLAGHNRFFLELALSLSQLNGSGDLIQKDVTKKDVTSAIRCHTLHPTLSCVIECHDPQVVSFNAAISACEKGGGSVELMQASKVVLCGYVYVASYVKSFLL
jgi:Holliday junction resolvasome RuvABC endonuclease subunit